MTAGDQRSAFAIGYAGITYVGIANITRMVAPVPRSFAICERMSTAPISYDSRPTIFDALAPSPARSPRRLSAPKLSFW